MPSKSTSFVLTSYFEDFVNRLVGSGRYKNASDVMQAGLRALEREERELAELRVRIAVGLDELDRGEGITGSPREIVESAFERGRQKARS